MKNLIVYCFLLSFANADMTVMSKKRIKLPEFAKQQGLAYGTVYKYWKQGRIEGIQIPDTGTILVSGWKEDFRAGSTQKRVVVYARSADTKNRAEIDEQLRRLRDYAVEKEYSIVEEAEETGFGFSASRNKLIEILGRNDWDILLVENRETAVKFGFDYLQAALLGSGRRIEYRTHLPSTAENVLAALLHNTHQLVGRVHLVGDKRKILDAITRIEN